MVKRSTIAIFMLLCIFLTAGLMGLPSEAGGATVTGKVKDVDLKERSVIVGGPDGDMAIYVDNSTRISQGGAARSLTGIKVGSVVRIEYRRVGDDLVANRISLLP